MYIDINVCKFLIYFNIHSQTITQKSMHITCQKKKEHAYISKNKTNKKIR